MTVCGISGAGKIIDPLEAIVRRDACTMSLSTKTGMVHRHCVRACMVDLAPSLNLPIRVLSKGENSDETGVSRRWCKTSSGRSHFIEHFALPVRLSVL
ncbi:unnamed protein product [Fusarium graminearum]|uniref:Uncharacterized protein n=1 Tax=Gibberella zeae TaxID=5518 RepID=A0A4E9E9R0_GIBZA|nr:unnamed protein product [Fusarium graminearum]